MWLLDYRNVKSFHISLMATFPASHLHSENYLSFVFISVYTLNITCFSAQTMEFIIIISAVSSIEFQIRSYHFWELSMFPYTERIITPSSVLSSMVEQMLLFSESNSIVFQLMMRTYLVSFHIIDKFSGGANRIDH